MISDFQFPISDLGSSQADARRAGHEPSVTPRDSSRIEAGGSQNFGDYIDQADNGLRSSASPAEVPPKCAGGPLLTLARAQGNVVSAQPDLPSDDPVITRHARQAPTQPRVNGWFVRKPRRIEAEVYAAARKPVIAEILALLGNDLRSPMKHAKYLETIPFADLCARRDQLKDENQRKLNLFGQEKQP